MGPRVSALPSGACENAGETCRMAAVKRYCPQTSDLGDLLSFTCQCMRGQWRCTGVVSSGIARTNPCADGAPDPVA